MRLVSSDSAVVELRPAGYQFPVTRTPGDGDANWLTIEGSVRLATGATWSFRAPCLTTWEGARLLEWLRQVVDGTVLPSPSPSDDIGSESFTEPTLAFSLAGRGRGRLQLRVHLALEALPPWADRYDADDIARSVLVLDMSEAELATAADEWASDLAVFPGR